MFFVVVLSRFCSFAGRNALLSSLAGFVVQITRETVK